jgi:hypothetical protein
VIGLPPEAGRFFALATGAICPLGFKRDTRVISRWNVSVE